MNDDKKNKKFDSVQFVRNERLRLAKELKGKTIEEILAYFKKAKAA